MGAHEARFPRVTKSRLWSITCSTRVAHTTMRKLDKLTYDAIGASLDCSAERGRSHVVQAVCAIRHRLAGTPTDSGDGWRAGQGGRGSRRRTARRV
jgi:hypothetical protein